VRFVQLWSGADNGFPRRNWDSHEDIAAINADMGTSMDKPAAALIKDLKARGLLDAPSSSGRRSSGGCRAARRAWPRSQPVRVHQLAGRGGIRGGVTYGASDEWSFPRRGAADVLLRCPCDGVASVGYRS